MNNRFPAALLSTFLFVNSSLAQSASLELPKGCKENSFMTTDSVRLRYVVSGKGVPLIFIPGWTMPAEIWEKQIEHFSKTNMVIAVDPRSQGKSAHTTEGLYLEREARDIKELTDHLNLSSYYLVGWSWAGPMLHAYLKQYNTSRIKGVIIVDAPIKLNASFLQSIGSMIKGLLHDRPAFTANLVKRFFVQPQTEVYLKKVSDASLTTPTSAAITLLAIFYAYNDAEWMQTIKTTDKPILFIAADGKEEMYRELNKEVKLNYVIIPGAGHTVFVDKPVEFNKILEDFISKK